MRVWLLPESAPAGTHWVILGICRSDRFCLLGSEGKRQGHAHVLCPGEWKAVGHMQNKSFPKTPVGSCTSRNFAKGIIRDSTKQVTIYRLLKSGLLTRTGVISSLTILSGW